MKISKIKVNNYRLLKSLELNMEDDLSLVIGKNNCGKTSLLSILDKFIGNKSNIPSFAYDDFNIDFQKDLENKINSPEDEQPCINLGISLKLFIEYNKDDSLANISKLMMDLDPENKTVVLLFEYILTKEDFDLLRGDFSKYKSEKEEAGKELTDKKQEQNSSLFSEFMKGNYKAYFRSFKKSIAFDFATQLENETEYIDIVKEKIPLLPIINFNIIHANRDISNKDSDKTLSVLASEYYKKKEEAEKDSPEIKEFKEILVKTDGYLGGVYARIFEKVVNKVQLFGGIKKGESIISINSTLQHRELLKGNTTVMYDHDEDCSLPENYNGLGYLNLISMIFDIELLINDFRRGNNVNEEPADINLLFIEEPEAHTHPQMQYVFIKNIKNILKDASRGEDEVGAKKFQLQTIITSHSSHITSESKFDDIKYFHKIDKKNEVIAQNLKDLKKIYGEDEKEYFKFLKQYLTLHRAELFFADKAIFIEGDTERILLPAMMKKIDQEDEENGDKTLPLLSQNVSIIEVGAYSHIFEKFFDFIGLKSLVVTDIDATKKVTKTVDGKVKITYEKCRVDDAEAKYTSNASLQYFFSSKLDLLADDKRLEYFKNLLFEDKKLKKDCNTKRWTTCSDGHISIVYQNKEKNSDEKEYCARSFEDAFFHLNKQFIIDCKLAFKRCLKNIKYFEDVTKDSYDLASECVDKKPSLAMEILINSETDGNKNEFSNWHTPTYIKEGLSWLKKD